MSISSFSLNFCHLRFLDGHSLRELFSAYSFTCTYFLEFHYLVLVLFILAYLEHFSQKECDKKRNMFKFVK